MTIRKVLCAVATLATLALHGASARAYHNADFATPIARGGGNGMYFTGSARYKRLDCTACHALAEQRIGIEVSSQPPELFTEQRWTPGQTYDLTVTMTGEHLGDTSGTNGYDHNSFVAELNDDRGELMGTWAGAAPQIFTMDVAGGDPQIVSGYSDDGATTWTLQWTAPPANSGRLTLHLGAVDGNAAGGGVDTVVDPFGDDVFVGAWRFCEGSQTCETAFFEPTEEDIDDAHESPATGCSVSAGAPGWTLSFAGLAMLGFASGARRRRCGLGLVLLCGVAAGSSGCLDQGTDPVFEECPNGICEYSAEGEPFGTAPTLDARYFECEAQPVLQARCSNFVCHGDPGRPLVVFAPNRFRLDAQDTKTVVPTTAMERQANFDAAREFSRGDVTASSLLVIKPLDTSAGGYYHFGESLYYQSDVFKSTDDIGYQKLLDWIGGATAPPDCTPTSEVGL